MSTDKIDDEDSSSLGVDTGVFAITDPYSRVAKQFYCFVCWKQGHFALDFPLISESDKKIIAVRKMAALELMLGRPVLKDRSGRVYPNIPYQGGVNPPAPNPENYGQ